MVVVKKNDTETKINLQKLKKVVNETINDKRYNKDILKNIKEETKEDLKYFEILLKSKTIKVEDKEGKLVDFSDAAKKHLVERLTELSKYWIARNSK